MASAVLYAGPSAWGLPTASFAAADVDVRPPARRGDIDRLLLEQTEPGTIVLCDGIFQSVPAVSHAELCEALDRGWRVWGVSSLGAIRAWELRAEGMRGFGAVHAMFARFDDFTDDEMCQLHFPEPPWFSVSEPLVNVRFALDTQARALGIPDEIGAALVAALKPLWFGDRTVERMREILVRHLGLDAGRADAFLEVLPRCRVKTSDLVELLARCPWKREDDLRRTP